MSDLDLSALVKVNQALDEALENSSNSVFMNSLSASQRQLIIAGVIQHFEFCYEQTYKMLKRQLEEDSANPAEVDQYSFQELLRVAAERGLISDVALWFEFRQQRNITAHTDNDNEANRIYDSILAFHKEAHYVLEKLQQRHA